MTYSNPIAFTSLDCSRHEVLATLPPTSYSNCNPSFSLYPKALDKQNLGRKKVQKRVLKLCSAVHVILLAPFQFSGRRYEVPKTNIRVLRLLFRELKIIEAFSAVTKSLSVANFLHLLHIPSFEVEPKHFNISAWCMNPPTVPFNYPAALSKAPALSPTLDKSLKFWQRKSFIL